MEKYTADRIVTINVDVQNDFMPGGSLAVPNGGQIIDTLNRFNNYTRLNDGQVIFTGDQHPANTPHFGPNAWPVHCVKGTHGAALDKRLNVRPGDIMLDKGIGQTDGYSAFEGRTRDDHTLEQIVRPRGRERVAAFVGGVATEYCVLNTVLDGAQISPEHGTLTFFVMQDAIRGIHQKDTNEAIKRMRNAGAVIINSSDILNGRTFQLAA